MEIIERIVVLPENRSFLIRELELKNNKGIIHTHDKYELNFVVDAYGKRFISGNISKFIPGDLIFMAPGVPHCWEIDNKEMEPSAITMHFHRDFFENAIMNLPELGPVHNLVKKSRYGLYIKGMDMFKLHNDLKALLQINDNFDSLTNMLNLLRDISLSDDIQMLENSGFKWEADQQQRLNKVYEYVFYNFQKNIKLNEIASLIGISEGAFCSYFKKNTKKTFMEFLKEVRIGYACKLLHEDIERPISQICFESGYNNFANFNRQFREITNLNPKDYRKKISNKVH